jgi:hypothetical protein
MKKLILLFTIVCSAGQLYGMEPELNPTLWEQLPKELKQEIISTTLATSNSVDDAVNAIKALGTLHGVRYNTQAAIGLLIKTLPNDPDKAINQVKNLQGTTLEAFTTLVHLVSDKFPEIATEAIAEKFETPTAQKYVELGNALLMLSGTHIATTINEARQIIKDDGADVNFTALRIVDPEIETYYILTPLFFATQMGNDGLRRLFEIYKLKEKTWSMMRETTKQIERARKLKGIQ